MVERTWYEAETTGENKINYQGDVYTDDAGGDNERLQRARLSRCISTRPLEAILNCLETNFQQITKQIHQLKLKVATETSPRSEFPAVQLSVSTFLPGVRCI